MNSALHCLQRALRWPAVVRCSCFAASESTSGRETNNVGKNKIERGQREIRLPKLESFGVSLARPSDGTRRNTLYNNLRRILDMPVEVKVGEKR